MWLYLAYIYTKVCPFLLIDPRLRVWFLPDEFGIGGRNSAAMPAAQGGQHQPTHRFIPDRGFAKTGTDG
jgi:hypothetical protein